MVQERLAVTLPSVCEPAQRGRQGLQYARQVECDAGGWTWMGQCLRLVPYPPALSFSTICMLPT